MTKQRKSKVADLTSDNIDVRGGLDGVRTNASMYLGSTDFNGLFLAVRELLDNVVDEYMNGRATAVRLHIDKDGSYWVLDNGTGIPQGIKQIPMHVNGKDIINKLPTMQAVFGELHTSGKYRADAYKVSIGTHGIGSKGTNATSEYFDVVTMFKGKWYTVGFKKGKLTTPVKQLAKAPKGPDGKALVKGTCIHFKPDTSIFSAKSFPLRMATEWSETMSYLNKGFAIIISSSDGKKKTYLSKRGPLDYIDNRVLALKTKQLSDKIFEFHSSLADVVVSFTNCEGSDLRGFTMGLFNPDGGTHVKSTTDALFTGLVTALNSMGKGKLVSTSIKGEKKNHFTQADFKEGLLGLVNARLHKAKFSGQNKAKLTDDRLGKEFVAELAIAATAFFTKNKTLSIELAERAARLSKLKFNFANDRKLVTNLRELKKRGLPVKYAPPNRDTKLEDRELFLIEGDSAGGTAKECRESYQGILPLRGKIDNALRGKGDKVLTSEEVLNILGAIGFDPKLENPYEKLTVGKIILLADPDPDGAHINTLLLTLFYKYLPEAFERGLIYVSYCPEFYAIHKGVLYSADGAEKLRAKMNKAKVPASVDIQHIKGWGEITPNLLSMLAMHPSSRSLIRIKPISKADSDFSLLMAEDVGFRKTLLGLA